MNVRTVRRMYKASSLLACALVGCGSCRSEPGTVPAHNPKSMEGDRPHSTAGQVPKPTGLYTLRYAAPYPARHPFGRADQQWIQHVQAASRGRLRIDAYWSGTLISADHGMLELRHGVADVASIRPIYERGGAHALRTQTGFYAGAQSFAEQVAIYRCLSRRFFVFRRELSGLTVLAVQGGTLPGIVTRRSPVRDLEDLAGLRVRAPVELLGVLVRLGADPVNMPMGEVYGALARGVIDGVVAPLNALGPLHLGEVAKHYTALAIPRGAYPARAIRTARLRQLSPELQKLLVESGSVWERGIAREVATAENRGRRYALNQGMEVHSPPQELQHALDEAYAVTAQQRARALTTANTDGEEILVAAHRWIAQLDTHGSDANTATLCPID